MIPNQREIAWFCYLRSDPEQYDRVKTLGFEELSRLKPYLRSIISDDVKIKSLADKIKVVQLDIDKAVIIINEEFPDNDLTRKIRLIEDAWVNYFFYNLSVADNKSIHIPWDFSVEKDHIIVSFATITKDHNFDSTLERLASLLPDAKHPNQEPEYDLTKRQ